jgi:alcohol dehydrogenase
MDYYNLPTEIYFGEKSITHLKDAVGKRHKILLVTGKSFLRKSGWLKKIKKLLAGNKISILDGIYENPDVNVIEKGLFLARKNKVNMVVGVGGGSVLDSAKAIAVLVKNNGKVISFLDKKIKISKQGIKCIAIPTTAGSSSEATPYSVISVPERGIKITLAHKYIYPSVAIIDPDFLRSLPVSQVANPGIDALCHAVESYWNVNHNLISDTFALEAIRLIFRNLPKLYGMRSSALYRRNMARASLFAGLAFSNTRTTACHSISYPLTTIFGIPHGQACAVTLSEMLLYNAKTLGKRMEKLNAAIGVKNVGEAVRKVRDLMISIGLKVKLSEFGLSKKDLAVVIEKGFTPERMINNPRRVTRQAMQKILRRIF